MKSNIKEPILVFIDKEYTAFVILGTILAILLIPILTNDLSFKFLLAQIILELFLVIYLINYLFRFFQKKPEIIISSDGIEFYRFGFIAWSQIKLIIHDSDLGIHPLFPKCHIYLTHKSFEIFKKRQSWLIRLISFPEYGRQIPIYPFLKISQRTLFETLNSFLSQNRLGHE